jgi:hypothetical protein
MPNGLCAYGKSHLHTHHVLGIEQCAGSAPCPNIQQSATCALFAAVAAQNATPHRSSACILCRRRTGPWVQEARAKLEDDRAQLAEWGRRLHALTRDFDGARREVGAWGGPKPCCAHGRAGAGMWPHYVMAREPSVPPGALGKGRFGNTIEGTGSAHLLCLHDTAPATSACSLPLGLQVRAAREQIEAQRGALVTEAAATAAARAEAEQQAAAVAGARVLLDRCVGHDCQSCPVGGMCMACHAAYKQADEGGRRPHNAGGSGRRLGCCLPYYVSSRASSSLLLACRGAACCLC